MTREITPPKAKKIPFKHTFHNDMRIDNYEWMRDKKDPEVIKYIKEQNKYTDKILASTNELKNTIEKEIRSRINENETFIPTLIGDYWYGAQMKKGLEYPIYSRIHKDHLNATCCDKDLIKKYCECKNKEIIFDSNLEDEKNNSTFFSLGTFTVTKSGKFLIYSLDSTGNELYDLYIRNLENKNLADTLIKKNISSNAKISTCENFIIYTTCDNAHRPCKVWLHKITKNEENENELKNNEHNQDDRLIYSEPEQEFSSYAEISNNNKYLIIDSLSTDTTESSVLKIDELNSLYEKLPKANNSEKIEKINHLNVVFEREKKN